MSSQKDKLAEEQTQQQKDQSPLEEGEDEVRDHLDVEEEDNDEEWEGEGDFAPLVGTKNKKMQELATDAKRRRALEITMLSEETRHHPPTTFCGDTMRLVGSLILACLLLGPWIYTHVVKKHSHPGTSSTHEPVQTAPPNDLDCSQILDVNFTDLYLSIEAMGSNESDREGLCKSNIVNPMGIKRRSDECACRSPLVPKHGSWLWSNTSKRNMELAATDRPLDVVFYGDSITEQWLGTAMLRPRREGEELKEVFRKFFTHEGGADLEGLPLGISGDVVNQLLYRLDNGEMPDTLHPKVWWVLIGTNDFAYVCSPETILVGILNIVQQILDKRPNEKSVVMINGVLPKGIQPFEESLPWFWIQWVNARLECFANNTDRVAYFNASTYFFTSDGKRVDKVTMQDYLHPSAIGAERWAKGISDRLHEMLDEQQP